MLTIYQQIPPLVNYSLLQQLSMHIKHFAINSKSQLKAHFDFTARAQKRTAPEAVMQPAVHVRAARCIPLENYHTGKIQTIHIKREKNTVF